MKNGTPKDLGDVHWGTAEPPLPPPVDVGPEPREGWLWRLFGWRGKTERERELETRVAELEAELRVKDHELGLAWASLVRSQVWVQAETMVARDLALRHGADMEKLG